MAKVHFITQGCSANQADSEIMAGTLQKEGHVLAEKEEDADIVVFNTCTVKGPTESFFKKKLAQLEAKNIQVILAGCIPQSERKLNLEKEHSMIGTYQLGKIAETVSQTLKGNVVTMLERENTSRLNLPKIRKNPLIEIVPLSHGCLGSCTFCKTKHARGNLYSYPVSEIVRNISTAVREGAREIWLTSQDNGAYGLDQGTNLVELLRQIIAIPREFKVRVGMANPEFVVRFADELIPLFKHEKIYKFLHVPVQAGSNAVLRSMKREYTVEQFKEIVMKFREAIPEITIATDIICGFPTETEQDFEATLAIMKETTPNVMNISRFWPRPGTPAAKLKQIEGKEINRRTKAAMELFIDLGKRGNERWKGWQGAVFISEQGKEGTMVGRNYAYKPVILQGGSELLGKELNIAITDWTAIDIRGEILQSPALPLLKRNN